MASYKRKDFYMLEVRDEKRIWELRPTLEEEKDYPKLRMVSFKDGTRWWNRLKREGPPPKYVMEHFPRHLKPVISKR